SSNPMPIVIVGGGLSGLVAATTLAESGQDVVVLEKSTSIGGRAVTRGRDGYHFNLGPHALYGGGELRRTLKRLGVDVTGGVPTGNGSFGIRRGTPHTLPVGLTSLITTSLLTLHGKMTFARLLKNFPSIDARSWDGTQLDDWLATIGDAGVADVIRVLSRVTTFTNDPKRQSAGATIAQIQLSLRGSVLYLDGGWQTIVDGLGRVAREAGVEIRSAAPAIALERRTARDVDAVRLADGTIVPASAVIVAAGPADVDALTRVTRFASELPPPVRVASLDIALTSLPKPKRAVAFGVDAPLYFSVHSAIARLAPEGGAVIHASKYLAPDESAGADVEREIEALVDMMQPGWRDRVAFKQYLPNLTVTHAELAADRGGINGRPQVRLDAFDNVFIAGDWVGRRGQLSDGAAASAADAAGAALQFVRSSPARPEKAAS
ncbi:MAG TPA: FAD-dependent oxidoreductase, partial [Vicinamibacterales bacterium]|nr:FAD-dependent oxidoreductase [Vicinamibacterales bacterium]